MGERETAQAILDVVVRKLGVPKGKVATTLAARLARRGLPVTARTVSRWRSGDTDKLPGYALIAFAEEFAGGSVDLLLAEARGAAPALTAQLATIKQDIHENQQRIGELGTVVWTLMELLDAERQAADPSRDPWTPRLRAVAAAEPV